MFGSILTGKMGVTQDHALEVTSLPSFIEFFLPCCEAIGRYRVFSSFFLASQVRIFETAPVGSVVAALLAVDKDRGANARLSYALSAGNVGGAFAVDADTGLIRLAQTLDVGAVHEYMLVVRASDGGAPPLSATCRVHILVTMAENDPPKSVPSFTEFFAARPLLIPLSFSFFQLGLCFF